LTLQQLTYFLAAVEHGSFSAAAKALHMAQPSMSDQIRRLEAELGVSLFARAGRRLELTEAGRLLRPQAERTLAAAHEAAESVREVRDVTGGTVAFGTFGSAHHYLLGGLVQEFRARHPGVRVRVLGQNSVEVADAVRDGHLEAGLVVLPVDDRGLDVRPAMREEILYVSAEPRHVEEPMTIERLAGAPLILYDARWGSNDPTRRQLAERAQRAGVKLEPEIEVEYITAALDLAARGLGDTLAPRSIIVSRGLGRRLSGVPFDPPLYDTFAFITRRDAHLSPATRAFVEVAERRVGALRKRLAADVAAEEAAREEQGSEG
jgi:DNA-binding transcriptional LysR family regulator